MRKRLGGRLLSDGALPRPDGPILLGAIVTVEGHDVGGGETPASGARVGVLVAISGGSVDVYLERSLVKRTASERVSAFEGSVSTELASVAESARIFGRLIEGQRVEIERAPSDVVGATLVEKCRYGAIVELDDRSLSGVGFRKIWPKPPPSGDDGPS